MSVSFFARWRVPLGFGCAGLAWLAARPTPATLAAGAVVAVAGELVRIWAAGHLEKGREVTSSGPYRWMPHPLYVGSVLMGAGLAIAARSSVVLVVVVLYLGLTIPAAIRTEEALLRRKFGEAYEAYRRGRAPHDPRHFSLARARRNREHRAVLGLGAALGLLALRMWV